MRVLILKFTSSQLISPSPNGHGGHGHGGHGGHGHGGHGHGGPTQRNATQPFPLLDTVDNWTWTMDIVVPGNSQLQLSIIGSDMPSALGLVLAVLAAPYLPHSLNHTLL